MNKDFRVAVTMPVHWKITKLMNRLGDRAFYCLIRLWAYVAQYKPKGELTGMKEDDIEVAADWRGEPGSFVETLSELNLLRKESISDFVVNDWKEHNSFAFFAPERTKKASKAACARHRKKKASAKRQIEQCSNGDLALLKPLTSNAPSPSPSPSPAPSSIKNPPTPQGEGVDKKPSRLEEITLRVLDSWNKATGSRRGVTAGLIKMVERNLKLDPEWADKYEKAAPSFPKIDDSQWPQGKVRFEWTLHMYNQNREIDPVVDKVLAGAYRLKGQASPRQPREWKPEKVEPVDQEKARAAMKEAISRIGRRE